MSPLRRRIAVLAIAGTAIFGLSACTGTPVTPQSSSTTGGSTPQNQDDTAGDEGQTTAEACTLIQDTITQATDEFENVSSEDPAAVVAAMEAAAQRIAEASTQVTNDEVAALLPSLQGMFQGVADAMGAIAEGDVSKLSEVEELGTGFQETSEKFQALCAP